MDHWCAGVSSKPPGMFRIDPNLTWGNQLISNDVQGGYYRLDYQGRRWLADAGVDEVRPVSGIGGSTTFLTGDARYQLSRDWGIGGVANPAAPMGATAGRWKATSIASTAGDRPGTGRFRENHLGPGWTLTARSELELARGLRLSTSHGWNAPARRDRTRRPLRRRTTRDRPRRLRRRSVRHAAGSRRQRTLAHVVKAGPRPVCPPMSR